MDLLAIKPNEIRDDIGGRYLLITGSPKIGKTTLASKFPDALLVAFEKGYSAIPGVRPFDCPNWIQFKKLIKELAKDEVKAEYKTIIIDTYSLAASRCEQYIIDREGGGNSLGEVGAYGSGYKLFATELSNCLTAITQLGYGLVCIAHTKETKVDDGASITTVIAPDLGKREFNIINRLVDCSLVLYDDGENGRMIYPRAITIQKPGYTVQIEAGNRIPGFDEPIPLDFDALTEAIVGKVKEAGGKKAKKGAPVQEAAPQEVTYDYDEIKTAIGTIVKKLATLDKTTGTSHMSFYQDCVSEHLGVGKLVKDTTRQQAGVLSLLLDDLEDYAKNNGIE